MRVLLRRIASSILYPFLLLRAEKGTLRVLTYHRVNSQTPTDRLSVSTEVFRKQMALLHRRGYRTLAPEELSVFLREGKPFPERSVVITFDDGYRDNFLEAWPILKEFGFRATIFVATGLIGKMHDGRKMLTWGQIRSLAAQGISFGSHTVHHVHLDEVLSDEKQKEAASSKQELEEKLGREVASFCYPFGGYDPEAKEALRKAGYTLAFTTKPGPVRPGCDLLELPRTEVSGFDSLFDFKKKLAGAFDWLHAMVQRDQKKQRGPRPIPLLHVVWSLGLGGAEQVVIALAKGADRTKFRPLVACLNEAGSFAQTLEKEGISVLPLHKKGKLDFSVVPKLIRIIREHRVQIVHTHLWGANVWGRLAARLSGVRVCVSTEHGIQEWRGPLHRFIDRILSHACHRLIFVAFSVRDALCRQTGIRVEKCAVIPNGINPDHFKPTRNRSRERKEKIVLSVGRLAPEKRFDILLRAMKEPGLSGIPVKLVIVGSGPEEQSLLTMKKTLGLNGRVQFLGERNDLLAFYHSADLFVQSSSREALSLALLEAMASELPVVVSNTGDHPRVIQDGVNGFLVPVGDIKALAEKMIFLIHHPEEAERVGRAARQTVVDHYSEQKMVRQTEALYEELLRHA